MSSPVGRATLEEPEIAFELLRHAHSQGYATEAAQAVLGAVAGTGRTRIWAIVRAWNTASFRVLEKLGHAYPVGSGAAASAAHEAWGLVGTAAL